VTQDRARTREVDEALFGKTQAQLLARRRVVEEQDEIAAAREENTDRLRALRLAKEALFPTVKATKRVALKALPAPRPADDQAADALAKPKRTPRSTVKAS
jgi:hypothetical protein